MTAKDFELIARVLRSNQNTSSKALEKYFAQMVFDFADELQGTNPAFDRLRFINAAMYK